MFELYPYKKGFPEINILGKVTERKMQCQETLYLSVL